MAVSGCPVFWNIGQLCRLFLVGSLGPHVMKIAEEIFAFKHELGSAIAQWGYVEAVSYTHLTLPTNREV